MSLRVLLLHIRASLVMLILMGHAQCFSRSTSARTQLRMDTEGMENTKYILQNSNKILIPNSRTQKILTIPSPPTAASCPIQQAESAVGMPWKTSIDASYNQKELTYMPFWTWQLHYMKQHLTNLTPIPATNLNGTIDFSLHSNHDKRARIVNLAFESQEYRKIRMTYYDAGAKTQVFNSLWYPRSNLPVLGIDLLQFHQTRHLAVVDFQPLYQNENDHDVPFQHLLKPIREQYDSLRGKMSTKFYDETRFFSQEMLFSRFEDSNIIQKDLQPAFQQYVTTHVDLVKSNHQTTIPWDRYAAYDEYSAQRDPAMGMFETMFGKEWADAYVHEFLFDCSFRVPDTEQ